jgi:DNA (cytosine-5)-methyltransferase 1
MYQVLDLFCGAGGLSHGFVEAGFELTLALDREPTAVETHKANFPDCAAKEGDVTVFDLPQTDVIVGGPPCQGFSTAGRRLAEDERNSLVGWFATTIARLKPAAFMFENVEGFLTAEGGKRVLELLEPLVASGYQIHLRKVNAANYGVPQHRKRVIGIGGLGWTPTFPEPTHTAFGAPGAALAARYLPMTPTLGEALEGLPPAANEPPGDPEDHWFVPLKGMDLSRATALEPGQTMRDLPTELWHDSYKRRAFRRVKDGTPTERRGGAPAGMRRLRADAPSKAITGAARSEFLHPSENRYLTLRESARLQTFLDTFKFVGTTVERMQLIGNAVPVRLGQVFAAALRLDMEGANVREGRGRLVSFVPTLSEGMSPALDDITRRVAARFSEEPERRTEQLALWR